VDLLRQIRCRTARQRLRQITTGQALYYRRRRLQSLLNGAAGAVFMQFLGLPFLVFILNVGL